MFLYYRLNECSGGSRDILDSKIYTQWWNEMEKCPGSYCKEKSFSHKICGKFVGKKIIYKILILISSNANAL